MQGSKAMVHGCCYACGLEAEFPRVSSGAKSKRGRTLVKCPRCSTQFDESSVCLSIEEIYDLARFLRESRPDPDAPPKGRRQSGIRIVGALLPPEEPEPGQ